MSACRVTASSTLTASVGRKSICQLVPKRSGASWPGASMTTAEAMTTGSPSGLEDLPIELHQLKAQLQSLRSALVTNTNVIADLLLLLGETASEQRSRARVRVGDAADGINRILSGPVFEGHDPAKVGC